MTVKIACDRPNVPGMATLRELEMAHFSWKCRDARSRVRLGMCAAILKPSGWTVRSGIKRPDSTRLLVLVAVSAVLVLPSYAAEKITVTELEQIIAQHAAQSHEPTKKHNPTASDEIPDLANGDLLQQLDQDDELLPRLAGIVLTERLSTPRMYQLIGKYNLGVHMQQALEQLADRAALKNLPASELLSRPFPDAETQQTMLKKSRAYVLGELSHLPNFVASQTTTRFDNSPVMLKYFQATTDQAGFHRVETVQGHISFQDGKEVTEGARDPGEAKHKDNGLESRGEFGTEAAVVLMDLENGAVTFDHWEQSMMGPAAVYRYSVPRESSHYEVTDACQDHVSFHDTPGYHGEIALDPKAGAIMRMTLEAESGSNDPISQVASVVEYGLVVLGNRRSICPLRSLTFMVEEMNGCFHGNHKLQKPLAMINQTIFSNYHRFGSSTTMIFDEAQNGRATRESTPGKAAPGGEKGLPVVPAPSGQRRRPD
jgi:hypothetical protein